ncbi:MAG: aldehyde ferredoxin oxidoreductase family protein [Dehalococcoidia bacterium]|nr:aldehyde ferredoxin oxidoreductase family protein [Dehalococcoidia bacterium]
MGKGRGGKAAMLYGYHGKVLRVDLSSRSYELQELPERVLRDFIGGAGLATRLLYEYAPAGCEPLSPENPLIFATSPLVDTPVTTSAKYVVVAKSPLTGFIGDSLSGSHLAIELKRTGVDALIVTGAAEELTCLVIENGQVRFLPAGHLAGRGASETEEAVRHQFGGHLRVAAIGPAGEKLVRYATVSNDGRHAGRTGNGAVMGAKRLKAIAVAGDKHVGVARPAALEAIGQRLVERSLGPATASYRQFGTAANLLLLQRLAALPSHNFRRSTFDRAERLGGSQLQQRHLAAVASCASCTIGCTHLYRTVDGGSAEASGRLEYETLFALGPLLGIDDPNIVIRAAALCDELGLDSISTGGTIAWAIECFERGLLNNGDTDGLDLRFGGGAALLSIIEKIAGREGIGDLLAEGCKRAAAQVGGGSDQWAMEVKGLEMPGYEPRSLKTMALGLAIATRGACHNRSAAYQADVAELVDRFKAEESRGCLVAEGEDQEAILDSLALCKFIRGCFADIYAETADIYNLVTGFDLTPEALRQSGERIVNLKKAFNIREGWRREDDTLPPRILADELPSGVAQGIGLTRAELELMVAAYYRARGWTAEGLIPEAKLRELGLWELVGPDVVGRRQAAEPAMATPAATQRA